MPFKWNPTSGYLDLVNTPGTVESIESSKILPMVGIVLANSTKVVETMPYNTFFAVRYFVAVQAADTRTNVFDYFIANSGASTVKETIYGRISSGLLIDISTYVDLGVVTFIIINNEAVDLTYKVQKLGF
jgi:hypothetical protein